MKAKLPGIPKALFSAENVLGVVKNCNVSMAEFDKQFWINQKTDSVHRHFILYNQSHFKMRNRMLIFQIWDNSS